MVQYIDDRREVYGVESICRVLPIAPATYYEAKAREADPARLPPRAVRDAELRGEIQRVWDENFEVYGVRKVWRQLTREGFDVARCTVELAYTDFRGHVYLNNPDAEQGINAAEQTIV